MRRSGAGGLACAAAVAALLGTLGGCASRPVAQASTAPGVAQSTAASTTPGTSSSTSAKAGAGCADFRAEMAASKDPGPFNPGSPGGVLPPNFHPTSMIQCAGRMDDVPGQGQWLVVDTRYSTTSVDALVAALRAAYARPPAPKPTGQVTCTAEGYVFPWMELVDAEGKTFHVAMPMVAPCNKPDHDAYTALGAIQTKVVATDRVVQVQSPQAQAAGCPQTFSDTAYQNSTNPGPTEPPRTGTPGPFFTGSTSNTGLKICYYEDGAFQSGTSMTGSPASTVYDGLKASPYATDACTRKSDLFAWVSDGTMKDSSGGVVELDACKHASPNYGGVRQPSQSVIEALLAAKK